MANKKIWSNHNIWERNYYSFYKRDHFISVEFASLIDTKLLQMEQSMTCSTAHEVETPIRLRKHRGFLVAFKSEVKFATAPLIHRFSNISFALFDSNHFKLKAL